MKLLYARVGWMSAYRGSDTEKPQKGGKYNETNIGYEVYNYLGCNGKYYGFVEPGVNNNIHVEKLCSEKKPDFADNVMVVWVSTNPKGGQYIVGWYKNARVYKQSQKVPKEVLAMRNLKDHDVYNIYSDEVYLIEPENRDFQIKGMGHSNIWYGNEAIDKLVMDYVESYDLNYKERIKSIESNTDNICGKEREAIVKIRVNQDKFRQGLLNKYAHCCLCGVNNANLLVASHIKPWAESDEHEKLDLNNGLLLCPNHDKLFDMGLISFDDTGNMLISSNVDNVNRIFMNINTTMKIDVNGDNKEYIRYHRENVWMQ
jgi:hypothetical protein